MTIHAAEHIAATRILRESTIVHASLSPFARMADKQQLAEELQQLRRQSAVAYAHDKKEAKADGRPFDLAEWLLGGNLDKKYPSGPAFQPHPYRPTLLNMTLAISARDWLATAIGSAVFYGIGHQSVGRLGMPGLSGHRLGMVLTIPTIAIGYTSSLKRSYLRHLGYLDNGNECMYPNYKRDDLTPYIVKHKVSDRHLD